MIYYLSHCHGGVSRQEFLSVARVHRETETECILKIFFWLGTKMELSFVPNQWENFKYIQISFNSTETKRNPFLCVWCQCGVALIRVSWCGSAATESLASTMPFLCRRANLRNKVRLNISNLSCQIKMNLLLSDEFSICWCNVLIHVSMILLNVLMHLSLVHLLNVLIYLYLSLMNWFNVSIE